MAALRGTRKTEPVWKRVLRQNQSLQKGGGIAVKKKRFSVEQILGVLNEAEVGVPIGELVWQVGSPSRPFTGGSSKMWVWNRPGSCLTMPSELSIRWEFRVESAMFGR